MADEHERLEARWDATRARMDDFRALEEKDLSEEEGEREGRKREV